MFKIDELLKATGGRLIHAGKNIAIGGISTDSRTIDPGDVFVAIKGNNFDGHDFIGEAIKKGASCIIKELRGKGRQEKKGNKKEEVVLIEVRDTIKALGDIARFQRRKFNIPVIAVTGSNGKTTTKEMVSWILSSGCRVLKNQGTKNNQIGLPATLHSLNSCYDIAVLEIGTNHFGEIAYLSEICQANIGIITNIGPAHLEYLRNLEGVFREKYVLVRNLKKPYLAILNADDELLGKEVLKKTKRPFIVGFGMKNESDFFASDIKNRNGTIEFLVNRKYKFTLNTQGHYNIYNALAAIAVVRIFGMEYKNIASRLSEFIFPPSRLNFITLNRIKFIDDTYNSNPTSLRHALEALGNFKTRGRKIFVMGDMLELGDCKELFHCEAGKDVARVCDVFIAVGELSKVVAKSARASGFDIKNIFTCSSSSEARDILFNKILPREDDIVLVKGSHLMRMEEVFKKT